MPVTCLWFDSGDKVPGCGVGAILRPPNCHHCHRTSQASDVLPAHQITQNVTPL